jgi:hypothetical protein
MLRAAGVSNRAPHEGKAREPVAPTGARTEEPTAKLARELSLTETEHLLLECLGSCPMVTRTQILETVFPGTHYRADSSHLRVHLHRLRAKLRSAQLTVKTVYGRGYRLLPLDFGGHAPRIRRQRGVAHARPAGQARSLVMLRASHGEVRTEGVTQHV